MGRGIHFSPWVERDLIHSFARQLEIAFRRLDDPHAPAVRLFSTNAFPSRRISSRSFRVHSVGPSSRASSSFDLRTSIAALLSSSSANHLRNSSHSSQGKVFICSTAFSTLAFMVLILSLTSKIRQPSIHPAHPPPILQQNHKILGVDDAIQVDVGGVGRRDESFTFRQFPLILPKRSEK